MTAPDWIALGAALDPWAELPVTADADRLYVDIPYSPSAGIVRQFRAWNRGRTSPSRPPGISASPPKFLYCGARGGGKTTQLRHLVRTLGGEAEVLLLDLAPVLPEEPSTSQLVTHIGLALLARLGQWEGSDRGVERTLATAAGTGFRQALTGWLGDLDLPSLVEAIAPLVLAADLTTSGAVTTATSVIKAIKAIFPTPEQLDPLQRLGRAEKLIGRLNNAEVEQARTLTLQVSRLAEALHGRSAKPVLLLVDGLDKMLSLQGVLSAFEDIDLLRALECCVVLTAPSSLSADVRFIGMRQDLVTCDLQNIPVVHADGTEQASAVNTMVEIATRRLGSLAIHVEPKALRAAARWSSGIPRDFLLLLSDAVLRAEERGAAALELAHVGDVAKEFRLRLQRPLTSEDMRLLMEVLQSRRPSATDRMKDLIFQNVVVWYPNDNGYYRPHELLVEWVQSEAARLEVSAGPG